MPTRLTRFMILLVVCSFSSGVCATSAHEMTADKLRNESLADDCLGGEMFACQSTRVATEIKRPKCPLMTYVQAELHATYKVLQDYSTSMRQLMQPELLLSLRTMVDVDLWTMSGSSVRTNFPTLAVSSPAIGQPPSPHRNKLAKPFAMRSWTKGAFIEDYRPYDFSIQDWRFGQTGDIQTAPSSARRAVRENLPVAELAESFEKYQRTITHEISTMERLGTWTESIVKEIAKSHRHLVDTISDIALQHVHTSRVQPYYTAPAWVVQELPNGQKVVLTLAQARQWELVSPYGASDERRDNSQIAECPIRTFLRDQLEISINEQYAWIGQSALQLPPWLTNWFDQIAAPQVARVHSKAQSEQR